MITKIFFSLCFAIGVAHATQISGRVIAIADGDTVTIVDSSNNQFKIRLSGIDAPEKKQEFGNASKNKLSDLIYFKNVLIEFDKRDRYNRIIGKITYNNNDIGLLMIKNGMAWHYKKYQNEQSKNDQQLYSEAEINAKKSNIGLWQDKAPTPPWAFRNSK